MIPDTGTMKSVMMGHMYWGLDNPADSYYSHDFGSEVGPAVHSTWDGTLVEAVEDCCKRAPQEHAKRTHRGNDALVEVGMWIPVKCHATHRL